MEQLGNFFLISYFPNRRHSTASMPRTPLLTWYCRDRVSSRKMIEDNAVTVE